MLLLVFGFLNHAATHMLLSQGVNLALTIGSSIMCVVDTFFSGRESTVQRAIAMAQQHQDDSVPVAAVAQSSSASSSGDHASKPSAPPLLVPGDKTAVDPMLQLKTDLWGSSISSIGSGLLSRRQSSTTAAQQRQQQQQLLPGRRVVPAAAASGSGRHKNSLFLLSGPSDILLENRSFQHHPPSAVAAASLVLSGSVSGEPSCSKRTVPAPKKGV